jgi:hypothetical protein
VKLASRGQRDMDTGPEYITDTEELRSVQRQAGVVRTKSLLGAATLTVLLLLV